MLPKENRLKNKKDFENVFKNGKGARDAFLALKFAGNNLGKTRVAVVCGLKISKKAVERNKIKRMVFKAVQNNFQQIKTGFDIVFLVFSDVLKKNQSEVFESADALLKKTKLI